MTVFQDDFKGRLEGADWRIDTFDEESENIPLGNGSFIYCCARAKPGTAKCCYAICQECFDKATTAVGRRARNRGDGAKPPNSLKNNKCCHNLQDLETELEPWWCDPTRERDGLFTSNWMARAKGCVGCKRMFVLKPKNGWKPNKLEENVRALYPKLHDGTLEAMLASN